MRHEEIRASLRGQGAGDQRARASGRQGRLDHDESPARQDAGERRHGRGQRAFVKQT
jgi:hypothetical protein